LGPLSIEIKDLFYLAEEEENTARDYGPNIAASREK